MQLYENEVEPDIRPLKKPPTYSDLQNIIAACANASLPQGPFTAEAFRAQTAQRNHDEELLTPFFVKEGDEQPIGFLRPKVLEALLADNEAAVSKMKMEPCWKLLRVDGSDEHTGDSEIIWGVAFNDWLNEQGNQARSEHMDRLARGWKEQGLFSDELKGWRNEQYPIYGPKPSKSDDSYNPLPGAYTAFTIERSASALFGFATFGCHMTAYVVTDNQYWFWVPKRAATKQTWPGFLDNSVAGGITAGDSPEETIIRECAEEASLPPDFVRKGMRANAAVSYIYKGPKGWLQPETEYTYDLRMPIPPEHVTSGNAIYDGKDAGVNEKGEPTILRPNDGEAESFTLMSMDETMQRMLNKEFKPNCAIVLVEFFLRNQLITLETDEQILNIFQSLVNGLKPLPGP